ncbi:MAG TPA: TPM domain-containing protein [Allosphingosinicella sp.]
MTLLRLLLLLCLWAGTAAQAQQFPKLTGRVVDQANLLSPADEAALTQKLEGLEQANSRQLVVATVPDLQGYPIEDYGYKLGRAWGIGQNEANNGTILLVAPTERKVRIEVGYGLEPILTDALSSLIVQNQILPRFKAGDYPGGINAGADAIIEQLQAPPEQAEQRALEASQAQRARQSGRSSGGGGGSIFPLLFWGFIFLFVILPMFRRGGRGRRYRRRGGFPIVIWGPGMGGGGGWGSGGGGWGGGGGGGFGGFSGGGGSFGGGGASGGW